MQSENTKAARPVRHGRRYCDAARHCRIQAGRPDLVGAAPQYQRQSEFIRGTRSRPAHRGARVEGCWFGICGGEHHADDVIETRLSAQMGDASDIAIGLDTLRPCRPIWAAMVRGHASIYLVVCLKFPAELDLDRWRPRLLAGLAPGGP